MPFLEHQPDHFDHLNPLTKPTTMPPLNGIPLRAPWPLWPPPRPWPLWSTWAWAGHRVAKFTMKLPKTTIRKSYKRIGLSCNIWFLSPFLKLPRTIIWKKWIAARNDNLQGVGSDCISRANSAIRGKLGTALQAYTLNPSTKFPPNPTSRKINTQELTSWHCLNSSMYAFIYCIKNIKNKEIEPHNNIYLRIHASVQAVLKCKNP